MNGSFRHEEVSAYGPQRVHRGTGCNVVDQPVCNGCPYPGCAASPSARRNADLPDMIMLDLIGPLTVFNIMQAVAHLIAKTMQPVMTDVGLPVAPTDSFESHPVHSTCGSCREDLKIPLLR